MNGIKVVSTEIQGAISTPTVEGQTVKGIWEQPEIVSELVKLPRVLPFYAKTRQQLQQIMEFVEQNPTDLAVQALLNAHSTYTPKTFPFRGFCLINGEQRMRQIEQVDELVQRPVWFLFSGMGIEQWRCGVAREMMKIDSFRSSIMRSCELLRPYGINLMQLITGEQQQQQQQDNQFALTGVESFVYMTAIQIALVDCLRLIGIRAEGMIGQSVGELVCAYIDQCLTHEQALMCSYYFANCLQQAQSLPQSLMAVVGDLTWEQLRSRCPTGVVPVCFDSVDQVVITGPVQLVRDLLRQLRLEGIYVREIEIPTTTTTRQTVNQTVFVQNFGLVHTQYLVDILPMLRKCLETLNIVPRTRSTRWISTACLPEQYSTPLYQTMNIDYLCKLFTTPVMLQQALTQVPRNAILIEVSPRSLMQTLLKKCLIQPTLMMNTGVNTQTVLPTIIPLMPTNTFGITGQYVLEHFLVQLGRLYLEGVEFDSIKLFVPTTLNSTVYPVPVEQRVLNLFSQWNVQPEPMSYIVMKQEIGTTVEQVIMNAINSINITGDIQTVRFTVDVESLLEKESYLLNHQINGRVLYPTTGYLYLVWKALAQLRQQKTIVGPISLDSVFGLPSELEQLPPVSFENVQIHRATVLREQAQQVVIVPQNKRVLFQINYQPSTGLFEIVEGMNLIVNGKVFVPTNVDFVTPFKAQWESQVRCNLVVPQEDIYNQFKQSGYELIGEFQPIVRTNVAGTQGELLWTGKWIPFLDSMLHMNYLAQQRQQTIESTGLMLPTRIRSVRINPIEHLIRAEKYVTLPVLNDLYTNKTICGGIEITGIQLTQVVLPKDQFNPSIVTRTIANYTPVQTQVQGQVQVPVQTQVQGQVQVPVQTQVQGQVQVPVTVQTQGQGQVQLQRQIIRPTFVNNWTIGQTCVLNGQLTHLIIGALDCDLGLELAQWMVQYCGVRYLVLTTQRVNTVEPVVLSAQQSQRLRYLQNEFGCQIKCVSTLDLNDETECLLLVRQACRMTSHFEGKIGSIFHLGGLFVEQPQQGMTFSVKSLNHLDRYTRNQTIMPDYGLFVVFTRSTNVGQTVDIQTIMENVCESRRRECGRHALLVDLMVLLANGQQSQVPIEYKNVIVRLEQMLVQSVRVQLPIELQQLPFFNLRVQEEVVGVEQNNQMINRARRQVQERPMTLMAQKCVERLNNVECGQEQPLFVVMPIESSVSYIRTWAQQLRVPVFGVQFTQECLRFETVEQLAQFYWQQIERVVPHVEKIHLVGHTFGVPVAFEMASRRPQQVVSLCLLDSGLTQTFLNGFVFGVESVCEFDGLFKFYQQFVAPNVRLSVEQFYQMLAQMPTFDERVKFVVGKIVEQSQMTFDLVDLETAVRSYVRFMIVSCKYVPSQPLRLNRIVVVRPNIVPAIRYQPWEMIFSQQETVDQEMIEKLFQGLRQYVYGRLQVHLIDGEQNNFFMQETATRIASILNNILVAEF